VTSISDTKVCMVCGEEFWYTFDCKTGEYTKTSACKCDRKAMFVEAFLEDRDLLETFNKEFKESEKEYKSTVEEIRVG